MPYWQNCLVAIP